MNSQDPACPFGGWIPTPAISYAGGINTYLDVTCKLSRALNGSRSKHGFDETVALKEICENGVDFLERHERSDVDAKLARSTGYPTEWFECLREEDDFN